MLLVRIAPLGLIVFASMSGCLDGDAGKLEPYLAGLPLKGFHATAEHSSGRIYEFDLAGPVTINLGPTRLFEAFVLTMSEPGASRPAETWYLDRDLRIVANVWGCGRVLGSCDQYERWSMLEQGSLGPMGLGYPDLADRGALDTRVGSQLRVVEFQATVVGGRLKMDLTMPDNGSNGATTTYYYTAGRLLPDTSEWSINTYRATDLLRSADQLAFPGAPPDPAPWAGTMFPGEDMDQFNLGVTHRQLAEAAFPGIAQANQSCVTDYWLFTRRPDGGSAVSQAMDPLGKDELATAWIDARVDGTNYAKEVKAFRGRLDGQITFETKPMQARSAAVTCETLRASPWPSLDVVEGLAIAQAVIKSEDVRVFNLQIGLLRDVDQPPEYGWHSYRFGFRPDWAEANHTGLLDLYEITFDAYAGGRFLGALLSPEDDFETTR